jgi:hypothetical protein
LQAHLKTVPANAKVKVFKRACKATAPKEIGFKKIANT